MSLSNVIAGAAPTVSKHPFITAFGNRLHCGQLAVTMPDGSRQTFAGPLDGPNAELWIMNPSVFMRRVATGGATGFAEAYMNGDFDTPDLSRLLELSARNLESWEEMLSGNRIYRSAKRLYHLMRPNTKGGSKKNIAYHYDLGNAFYETWLDPTMTYSSAVFDTPDVSLEDAQSAKYREIAKAAGIGPEDHVLEIGCGWGGFAEYAAKEIGAKVTGITISEEQFAFASARIQKAGLNDKVEIRRQDYRDTHGRFDRVASIEMFEAVGEKYWPVYFDKVKENLVDGGRAALQIITIADAFYDRYRQGADFIQRYIFPGGMLPSPNALTQVTEARGLKIVGDKGYGQDYAATLAAWHERFNQAWPAISQQGFDERFQRMWKYYLSYCEAGFKTGRIDVRQIALAKD